MKMVLRLTLQKDYEMGIGVGTAMLISGGVSLAGSVISSNKQQDAIDDAENEQQRLAEEARVNEQQLLQEQARQSEISSGPSVLFGVEDEEDDTFGTYDDFITPTKQTGVGLGKTTSASGLGF